MTPIIFKVVSQGEAQQYQKQDGSVLDKCPITLQELGAFKDDATYAAQLLGEAARQRWQAGDVVAARLRFTVHEYEGRTYQDIFVVGIMKLNK